MTNQKQAYLLLVVSGVFVLLLLFVGLPLLFNLSSVISSMRRPKATIVDVGLAPSTPKFFEDMTATKSANIKVTGVADPSTIIELFQNNFSQGTTTSGDDGKFLFDVSLSQGNNAFYAQATSSKGQKSDKSDIYVISFSNKNPKLDLKDVRDGDTIKDNPFKLTGTTDVGNTVMVNDRLAMVGAEGVFSLSLNLNNGDNKLKIVATDLAGNQTAKEITIKYSP